MTVLAGFCAIRFECTANRSSFSEVSMNISSLIGILFLALVSTSAYAAQPIPVPEPGILELLAVGAVAVALSLRKRK